MKHVADFIVVPLKAKDANWEVDFDIAFKLVSEPTARLLSRKLLFSDYETQVSILLSNIVYANKVADASGNLTNSFETDILKALLSSFPYFKTILANYAVVLQSMEHIQRKALQEQNLFEIGKYQYELDYGKQDEESRIKEETEELQETLGLYMNFDDEPVKEKALPEEPKLITQELPKLIWKSNVPYLKLFNTAKLYRNEWGRLDANVILALIPEFKLTVSEILNFIPVILAGYESMKPET